MYVGQDTLPDDTPAKLGLGRAVDMTKEWFVGKTALERLAAIPLGRAPEGSDVRRRAAGGRGASRGAVIAGGEIVGRVTSCAATSPELGRPIGLGVDPGRRRRARRRRAFGQGARARRSPRPPSTTPTGSACVAELTTTGRTSRRLPRPRPASA